MKYILLFLLLTNLLFAEKFYYEFGKKVYVEEVINTQSKSLNTNEEEIKEYKTNNGKTVKFKNEIIVECEKNKNCEDDFITLGIKNFSNISKYFYHIKLDSNQDIFEFSQKLKELDSVKIAHPDFIKQRVYR
jgi:hypothetical protein